MEKEEFLCTKQIEKMITNRKTDVNEQKILLSLRVLPSGIEISWTRQEVSILTEEYQKYPCLYQVKETQYKNKHARTGALESIKNALTHMKDVTIPEIKAKFKNLKTNVLQEYRKMQKSKFSRSGTDEVNNQS
ncbi:unnamed protein product [Psylliodes chrysocephalus]|uniref:MADF domain-containing protein n=1 Tax=Psylliodes chrysocephalus TaxID=3402493 RepID=A0A9P0CVL0_9CUCU|nr:unnamed protein product [Psylliodes chrysocephala]